MEVGTYAGTAPTPLWPRNKESTIIVPGAFFAFRKRNTVSK